MFICCEVSASQRQNEVVIGQVEKGQMKDTCRKTESQDFEETRQDNDLPMLLETFVS